MVQATDAGASFNTEFKGAINQDGLSVPSLKDWARGVLKRAKAAAPLTAKGKVIPKNPMTKFANDILAMKQYAWPEELNGLAKRVDDMYANASAAERKDLDAFMDSLFGSYQDSKSFKSQRRDFGWEFQQNMIEAARARALFDTPAAARLKPAGIRTGRAPTRANMSPDVAGDALFNMDDPAQVRELRKRIGDDLMNQGAAYFLQKQVSEATDRSNGLFKPEEFAKAVGLDNPAGPQYQAMKEALKTSDVKIEDV
ncbi:MAG TPA: hypothetical protein VH164_12285, partial [Ktedonobacteraceae bacterium]|nr:hypothetical protein [Ktedonobacteraceae bacterium]